MDETTIKNIIIPIIQEQLDCENPLESNVEVSKYGLDSLDMTHLLMEFEEEFDVVLDDEEWAKVKTIDDMVALVKKEFDLNLSDTELEEAYSPPPKSWFEEKW